MTLKKNLESELDTRWRKKGGPHRCPVPQPEVCHRCSGLGKVGTLQINGEWVEGECPTCQGTGEVWE